jgi:hypothetical protein
VVGAGGSAEREYARRRAREREQRRRNFRRDLALLVISPLLAYLMVRAGALALNEAVRSIVPADPNGAARPDLIKASAANTLGLLFAAAAAVKTASDAWGSRRTTEAWRIGAAGERATGAALAELPSEFAVIHDLRMPGSRANIDHLVIGPTGVFTIETKNYSAPVVIRRGVVRSGRRLLDGVLDQAVGQAEAVTSTLGVEVRPVVCVHGGGLRLEGFFQRPVVRGVRFCSGGRLPHMIREAGEKLSPEAVGQLVDRARSAFRPAVAGPETAPTLTEADVDDIPCGCGGELVRRVRRSDGVAFLGCTRFPACRATRPIELGPR